MELAEIGWHGLNWCA